MLVAHPKPMHRGMKRNRRCDFSARIGRDDNDASSKVLGEVVIASQQTGLA
jgi:hypothetical protein